jgi:two-component system, chemotaxis family, chemotaxis protein CheY
MNRSILIIDDSVAFSRLLTHILDANYDCAVARNGIEAFALLRAWTIPDLIICDLNMPEMDGISFLNELQNSGLYNCIPVIIMTGEESYLTDSSIVQDLQTRFIRKPFEPQALFAQMDELFADMNVVTA